MPSQSEIQQEVTHRILEGLKSGVVPWRKPWRDDPNCGAAANVISRKAYSGVNPMLLDLVAMTEGYKSRWWGTFEQWKSLGACVRKRPTDVEPGHWGTSIVFWKQIKKTKADENGDETVTSFPLLRYYTVFNVDQVDGEKVDHLRASQESQTSPLSADFGKAAEAIAATDADIRYGGSKACYVRPIGPFPDHYDGDYICLPNPGRFTSPHEFYATSLHELMHWSEIRLGWTGSYAMGELIAEIGAAFLCSQLRIPCSDDLTNHTAYLASWLKELQNDERAILKAASQASKAANFVLGFSRHEEAQPQEMQQA
jgi:antirestriction protein ArdC